MDPWGREGAAPGGGERWELLQAQQQGADTGARGAEQLSLRRECEGVAAPDHIYGDIALTEAVAVTGQHSGSVLREQPWAGPGLGEQSGVASPLCPSLGQLCFCLQVLRELGSLSLRPCTRRSVTAQRGRSRRGSAAQVGVGSSQGPHLQGSFHWPPFQTDPLQPPGPWGSGAMGVCGESSQVLGPGVKLPPHQLCPSQLGTAPLFLPLHPI